MKENEPYWVAFFKYAFLEPVKRNNSWYVWLLILFLAYAYNYHPVKYQKLMVNANPGSTSACNMFWCTHNCCDAVVCIKLAKVTRKTDPALLWFCTNQESFINIWGQELCFLIWRIWHGGGFPTQHSTDMRPNWGLLKTKQHKDLKARSEVLACHVSVYMIWWRRPVMMHAYLLLRIDQRSVALVLNWALTEFNAWLYRSHCQFIWSDEDPWRCMHTGSCEAIINQ